MVIIIGDKETKQICVSNGIEVINIPTWWDYTIESLESTLYVNNNLLFGGRVPTGNPIPSSDPNVPNTVKRIQKLSMFLFFFINY